MALDLGGGEDWGLVGQVFAGGLRVTERTGVTPQGQLYAAEDPDGRRVALLILPAEARGEEPAGVRSLRLATRIRHPNLAAVYAVGDMKDGSTYVALEELSGEPLAQLLAERSTLPIDEALGLTLQIAAGLEALHRGGIVHGNVSPSAIVVTRQPFGKSQVKIVGFSLDSDPQHATRLEAGNAAYASPERLAGEPSDARCDVYSVGALLHHLLSGSPPVGAQPVDSVPRIARPVLEKALARLGARYRTMSDLREALEALAAAAVASPDTVAYRRILGRAVAAGLVLAVAGVLLAPVWRSVEMSRSRPAAVPDRSESAGTPQPQPVRAAPPAPARAAEASPAGAEGRRRPVRKSSEPRADAEGEPRPSPEPPGYVGETRTTAVAPEPAQSPPPPPQRRRSTSPPTPNPAPAASRRPRAVLDRDQGLRLALGDVTRVGLAENVVEAQLGLLVVYLAPDGMQVPSASYNLQRLYLAYSAATKQQDTVALELRRNGELYGWFTREGLRYASPDPDRH